MGCVAPGGWPRFDELLGLLKREVHVWGRGRGVRRGGGVELLLLGIFRLLTVWGVVLRRGRLGGAGLERRRGGKVVLLLLVVHAVLLRVWACVLFGCVCPVVVLLQKVLETGRVVRQIRLVEVGWLHHVRVRVRRGLRQLLRLEVVRLMIDRRGSGGDGGAEQQKRLCMDNRFIEGNFLV